MDSQIKNSGTDAEDQDTEPATPARSTFRNFIRVAGGYWRQSFPSAAWGLTVACLLSVGMTVAVQVWINRWNKDFFDALEKKQTEAVIASLGLLGVLLVVNTVVAVIVILARMRLQVGWRKWLSSTLIERWFSEQRFYRLNVAAPEVDSPEYRIADDCRLATEPVVDFAMGILTAGLMLSVFVVVLWRAGGSLEIGGVVIPGFMVFVAAIYALGMSLLMIKLGKPLIDRIGERSAAEASLRQALVRGRENAESIAMLRGEVNEVAEFSSQLRNVVGHWRRVISRYGVMTILTSVNSTAAPLVPLIVMAPSYLTGRVTLGSVMQVAAAFVQVQVSLSWIVDNYARIAEWLASAARVLGLWNAFDELDVSVGSDNEGISIADSSDGQLHLKGLSVARHDGRVMIAEADTVIGPGEKVLLVGPSGTGKSTLIRALAGLWPWGAGSVLLPPGTRMAFLPQRPYIRPGVLRDVFLYTTGPGVTVTDKDLHAAMSRCGLRRLIPRLDDEEPWDKILSGGEQQRVGFIRVLLERPDFVVMDEATSALDMEAQDSMMSLFQNELQECTVITVGHRPELADYHTRTINLVRGPRGAKIRSQ